MSDNFNAKNVKKGFKRVHLTVKRLSKQLKNTNSLNERATFNKRYIIIFSSYHCTELEYSQKRRKVILLRVYLFDFVILSFFVFRDGKYISAWLINSLECS